MWKKPDLHVMGWATPSPNVQTTAFEAVPLRATKKRKYEGLTPEALDKLFQEAASREQVDLLAPDGVVGKEWIDD